MGKAAIEEVLENLKQLVIHHAHLIPNAVNQTKRLENILTEFKATAVPAPEEWREDEGLSEVIRRIRRAVYAVEDIVDAYVIKANDDNFHDENLPEIADVVGEVESAVDECRCIFQERTEKSTDFPEFFPEVEDKEQDESENPSNKKPRVKQTDMVGFERDMERLKAYLFEDSEELIIIPIVGMGGLGKTTLAENIFNHPEIRLQFPTRVWVYLSHQFTKKDIFLAILEQFTILTDDIKSKADDDLANLVVRHLENERFLIVMDDMWSHKDWDELKVALPMRNAMGRVLITTRSSDVGRHAASRYLHRLWLLSQADSFWLLKEETFPGELFPEELKFIGHRIVRVCGGLPLSILLIGGILVNEFPSRAMWEKIYLNLIAYNREKDEGNLYKMVMFCYENLPHHLNECFLYFGMFAEDFEIPVWKLIRLWIAEGFIPHKSGVNLEETAENYLEELIVRKLVKAEKFKLDGKVKTCRIHDVVRDFCIAEAGNEKERFSKEIRRNSDGVSLPPISEEFRFRRLCIHSDVLDFVSRKSQCQSVCSFVYSSRGEITIPMEYMSAIPKGFKRLRVLDVEPIKFFYKLPRDMFKLYHLRFLVLSFNLWVLPLAFSRLWNMETLVVNTNSRTLEVRADLLNLTRLRHFKTKASSALPVTSKSSEATSGEIQTIGAMAPESCTKDFFDRVPNLKRLGVRGKVALLLDVNNEALDSLGNLRNLEKLKLLNDVYPVPPPGAQLRGLPPASKFPPNLKILTLSRTSLDWSHMCVLGLLESLVVLKVKDKAFVGDTWEVADGGFLHLEVLHIERTNLKIWLASEHHFPGLRHLQLKHCDRLEKIPMELVDVPNFMKLDLFHCRRAAASALKIEEKKRQEEDNQFKLSIYPVNASFQGNMYTLTTSEPEVDV